MWAWSRSREEGFPCECVGKCREEREDDAFSIPYNLMRNYSILRTYTPTNLYHSTPSHKHPSPHRFICTYFYHIATHSYTPYTLAHSIPTLPLTFPDS